MKTLEIVLIGGLALAGFAFMFFLGLKLWNQYQDRKLNAKLGPDWKDPLAKPVGAMAIEDLESLEKEILAKPLEIDTQKAIELLKQDIKEDNGKKK